LNQDLCWDVTETFNVLGTAVLDSCELDISDSTTFLLYFIL